MKPTRDPVSGQRRNWQRSLFGDAMCCDARVFMVDSFGGRHLLYTIYIIVYTVFWVVAHVAVWCEFCAIVPTSRDETRDMTGQHRLDETMKMTLIRVHLSVEDWASKNKERGCWLNTHHHYYSHAKLQCCTCTRFDRIRQAALLWKSRARERETETKHKDRYTDTKAGGPEIANACTQYPYQ